MKPQNLSHPASNVLNVPWTDDVIHIDGVLTDSAWSTAARTGPFTRRDHAAARPYSSLHALWHDSRLHLALYAADDDIQVSHGNARGDAMILELADNRPAAPVAALRVDANGSVSPVDVGDHEATAALTAGLVVAARAQGTPNRSADHDAAWVVEMSVPLAALGGQFTPGSQLRFGVHRCNVNRDGHEPCGSWGEDEHGQVIGVLALQAHEPSVD